MSNYMFMDRSFIYGVGGWYLWWNCWHQKEYICVFVCIYIHINVLSEKWDYVRDLHLNLRPIEDVETGRTRNPVKKKKKKAQVRQRYQDAYKRGRRREKREHWGRNIFIQERPCWVTWSRGVAVGFGLWRLFWMDRICDAVCWTWHGLVRKKKGQCSSWEVLSQRLDRPLRRSFCHAH